MIHESQVDEKQIQFLYELGGPTLVRKMIDLFLENSPLRRNEIQQSESREDWEGLFNAVHKLKSSAGNFGAHPLFNLCGKIEEFIREKRIDEISPCLRKLEESLLQVQGYLREEKERIRE